MSSRYAYAKKQFTSWSYSRYRDYTRCPYFAKLKHLDKVSEGPDSPAMARGSAIGAMAEDYVKGKLRKLPIELMMFEKEFHAVRALKMKNVWAEESWCFDKNWNSVAWNDWNNVWFRVKMDLCGIDARTNVLVPVDHKTGKYRENDLGSYLEQLELYALGGMLEHPKVAGTSPRLWFLDEGIEYPQVNGDELYYPRAELALLQKKWLNKVKPMFEDTTFKPKPNAKCCYCAYSASKGGSCKF